MAEHVPTDKQLPRCLSRLNRTYEIGTEKNISHEITRNQTHELVVVFRVISCAFVEHLFSGSVLKLLPVFRALVKRRLKM